jgi:hypothetical protein
VQEETSNSRELKIFIKEIQLQIKFIRFKLFLLDEKNQFYQKLYEQNILIGKKVLQNQNPFPFRNNENWMENETECLCSFFEKITARIDKQMSVKLKEREELNTSVLDLKPNSEIEMNIKSSNMHHTSNQLQEINEIHKRSTGVWNLKKEFLYNYYSDNFLIVDISDIGLKCRQIWSAKISEEEIERTPLATAFTLQFSSLSSYLFIETNFHFILRIQNNLAQTEKSPKSFKKSESIIKKGRIKQQKPLEKHNPAENEFNIILIVKECGIAESENLIETIVNLMKRNEDDSRGLNEVHLREERGLFNLHIFNKFNPFEEELKEMKVLKKQKKKYIPPFYYIDSEGEQNSTQKSLPPPPSALLNSQTNNLNMFQTQRKQNANQVKPSVFLKSFSFFKLIL